MTLSVEELEKINQKYGWGETRYEYRNHSNTIEILIANIYDLQGKIIQLKQNIADNSTETTRES